MHDEGLLAGRGFFTQLGRERFTHSAREGEVYSPSYKGRMFSLSYGVRGLLLQLVRERFTPSAREGEVYSAREG